MLPIRSAGQQHADRDVGDHAIAHRLEHRVMHDRAALRRGRVALALLPSLAGLLAERISLEAIPGLLCVSLFGLLILYLVSTRRKSA